MKLQTKNIKEILTKFGIDFDPKSKISEVKFSNPQPTTLLYTFRFKKLDWAILFDEDAEDNKEEIISQLNWSSSDIKIFENPNLESSYGVPYQQKTCYLINKKSSFVRLDQFLSNQNPDISRSKIQKMIANNLVKVNGKIETSSKKQINPNLDKIELSEEEITIKPLPEIEIIYQDDNIMAIDKPAGVLTHDIDPENHIEETVADFAKKHGNFKNPDYRSGIVHRLDRATSGIILIAKNNQATEYLKSQFKDRKIEKTYIAISKGNPKLYQAKIDLPLKRSLKQPGKFTVDANGKKAISNYQVLKSKDNYNMIEIKPKTGRTHQIRVHLSYINLPIVGDYLYSGEKSDRLYLHAQKIKFTNLDGEILELETKLPKEFNKWI